MSAAASAAALIFASGVLAHGGETSFIVEPTMVPPGGGVAVRADLIVPGPVLLTLIGTDGSRVAAGVIEQTDQGHFEVMIMIPADLPAGHWTLLAEADGATIGSATLEVAGAPVGVEEGGQGPRDEDDSLLAPLPSGWQASRSNPPAVTSSAPGRVSTDPFDLVPIIALVVAIGALTLLALGASRSRQRGGGDRAP
jgi:hypothetical protein